jgi:hypothetical protein
VRLTKTDVAFSGLLPSLVEVIKHWRPGELESEPKYRDSLLAFLQKVVPEDCHIEKEYRDSGTTTDLCVRWTGLVFKGKVFVELKRNLDKKATLDRLIGQLETLGPGRQAILLVLVGRTDSGLLGRLKAKYKDFLDGLHSEPMAVVVVETSSKKTR